jgi:gamma-glutamyltranspeptidase / glutathione hydrolase
VISKSLRSEHAAVASEQPLASAAGYDVLRKGGNAFDAAVATSFSLAVTFHPAGGLGGDFFGMLYEAKSGKVHCLNASGWSPSGLTLGLVKERSGGKIPRFGPFTSMVPGLVGGAEEMHRRLGVLEFGELLSAASGYASRGFPAGEGICRSTAAALGELPDGAKGIFAPRGAPPRPGDWIRQENLGKVISEVAEGGSGAFYGGWPAEKICQELNRLGVPVTDADFKEFRSEWVDPLTLEYGGTTVYETPPNSMGATSLLILKLLSDGRLGGTGPLSEARVEATMDAVIPAYARRDEMLGDPRRAPVDLEKFMDTRDISAGGESRINSGDTTAFSIVDAEGNMVSGIQSLFNHFGSRVFVPECGIFLNNRGSGFSGSGPNVVAPRKRPLHTLSSMLLSRDGRPYLAIGTSGGDFRPLQHTLFVTNAVDYSMGVEANVGHPRFLWGGGRSLIVEEGYGALHRGRFEVSSAPMPGRTGVCQAVEVSERSRTAVCDVRGDGLPMGF